LPPTLVVYRCKVVIEDNHLRIQLDSRAHFVL
jgi:hypothetical protein